MMYDVSCRVIAPYISSATCVCMSWFPMAFIDAIMVSGVEGMERWYEVIRDSGLFGIRLVMLCRQLWICSVLRKFVPSSSKCSASSMLYWLLEEFGPGCFSTLPVIVRM